MKTLLTISFLFAFGAFAQHEPVSNMYWNNYSYFNPAMSGVKHQHEANVTYRSQFSRIIDSPTSWFVNYGTNINEKHGLGLNYVYESIGTSRTNRIKLNYNYQFELKEGRKLAIGTALSFRRIGWIPDWYSIHFVPQNDFLVDLGAAYYGKNITAGLAVTQIPIYQSSDYFDNFPNLTGNFRYEGALFSLPSLILETKFQTDFIRYRQDFNVGYSIKKFLEVGIGYRTSDAALINLTGIIKEKYRIGYSYAMTINKLSSPSSGTHEVTLGLRLPN